MSVHIAYIAPMTVDAAGNVRIRSDLTIGEALGASQQLRVVEDSQIPNTVGSPTIEDYIRLEDASGYTLLYLSNTMVVTGTTATESASQRTDWEVCHNEPYTPDNGGSSVLTVAQAQSGGAVMLEMPEAARHVIIRLRYDDATDTTGGITQPVVEVLALDSNGAVAKLRNLNGAVAGTVTLDASDPEDGTYAYTVPDDATTYDIAGHQWIVVGVQTAFDATTGDKTIAVLEAKPLI